MLEWVRRPEVDPDRVLERLGDAGQAIGRAVVATLLSDLQYSGYIARQEREIEKAARQEALTLPVDFDFEKVQGLGREARAVLGRFRPATLGQAGRLAGITPADIMLLTVALGR